MTTVDQPRGLRGWIKMAVLGVLVLALVLFFLDQQETRQQQQQALDEQAGLIQQQQAALNQQQAIAEKQLQTVDSLVDEYEGHIEQQKVEQEMANVLRGRQLTFAYVASGLSLASNLRMQIVEHYMMDGRFPESNGDVGLPSPERMGGDGVRSVAITQDGVIRVTYGAETGVDGGILLLSPSEHAQAGRVEWTCTTADYADIASFIPTCRYAG